MSKVTLKDGRTGRLINAGDGVANVRLDRTNQDQSGELVQVPLSETESQEEESAAGTGEGLQPETKTAVPAPPQVVPGAKPARKKKAAKKSAKKK